ncbi:hypothetical protein MNV49_002858 [Pseudohyphozyma bogoriensis]|nr:hypothetical protein MNV49_002858 [Pseudohyphozyma bogoriensis]
MDDDEREFATAEAGLAHYKDLAASLRRQLDDAEQDLNEFSESSKELQDELEKELARMEKGEKDMVKGLEDARNETEQWKTKYTAGLRDHTTTMTHMQRELETLRTSEKTLRTRLRDMELDNDDLEKSEREKDSSLQNLETRYGKSIERIALLEEELVTKAQLEEEVQRLKDELRELEEEVAIMRNQINTYPPAYPRPLTPPGAQSQPPRPLTASPPSSDGPSSLFNTPRKVSSSTEDDESTPTIALVKATPLPLFLIIPTVKCYGATLPFCQSHQSRFDSDGELDAANDSLNSHCDYEQQHEGRDPANEADGGPNALESQPCLVELHPSREPDFQRDDQKRHYEKTGHLYSQQKSAGAQHGRLQDKIPLRRRRLGQLVDRWSSIRIRLDYRFDPTRLAYRPPNRINTETNFVDVCDCAAEAESSGVADEETDEYGWADAFGSGQCSKCI